MQNPRITHREVLICAADVMRKRGICYGEFKDSKGRVCMLGAIRESFWTLFGEQFIGTAEHFVMRDDARVAIERLLPRRVWWNPFSEHHQVVSWNDERKPSAEQAARVLERAAGVV